MNRSIIKLSVLSLLTGALVAMPAQSYSQENSNPSVEKKESKPGRSGVTPFHGKLKAVDKDAGTISVGQHTYQITSDTIIFKSDQPGTLEDAVVGENVGGAYRKADDGRLLVTKVTFGPKPAGQEKAKKGSAERD